MELLAFSGVAAFAAGGHDIFLDASLLGYSASSRRFLKRMDGETYSRDDAAMAIAKTLILQGQCNWEEFSIAIIVAMNEFDRQERDRDARWRARKRRE